MGDLVAHSSHLGNRVIGTRLRSMARSLVESALEPAGAGPTAVAPGARLRAGCAAYRGVSAIVQIVVRDVVLGDVAPDVLVGPGRQWRDLPEAVLLVPAELRRVG